MISLFFLASIFCFISIVHLVAAVQFHRAKQAVAMLDTGLVPSPEAMLRVLQGTSTALRFRNLPDLRIGRAMANLSLATLIAEDRPTRERLVRDAVEDFRRGLELSPVNPRAWFRLAVVLADTQRLNGAASALELSLRTGPEERELIVPRAILGLRLWAALGHRLREAMGTEFSRSVELDATGFAKAVLESRKEAVVLAALAPFPDIRTRFARILETRAP